MVGWILLALLPGWAITRFAVKLSVITNSVLYIAFLFTSIGKEEGGEEEKGEEG